jgi:DNA topoisomerase-1
MGELDIKLPNAIWMRRHKGLSDAESLEAARLAGLRYVDCREPGIRRIRCGRGFRYLNVDSQSICDRQQLQRIKSLAIPPAWTRVWICSTSRGHIQAIGWDAKGRKQYRYHPLYREVRDRDKFGRMLAFGTVLAVIRKRAARDLRRAGLPREKVLAAVVRLLETTYIRVGNAEYTKQNGSFGLTTLRNRHLRMSHETLQFDFKGKSGLRHFIELTDHSLARVVRQCQELPGYRLFQYLDKDGCRCSVDSDDVNDYLRQITGQEFSAKDFRTWAGTVLAARELVAVGRHQNQRDGKRKVVSAIKAVAGRLGNRPATCRKYYIHPAILDGYSDGSLFDEMQRGAEQQQAYKGRGLRPEEYSVMVLIAKFLENAAHARKRKSGAREFVRAKAA